MNRRALAVLALLGVILGPRPARAQLVLGQYEDEAPLGSWNGLGIPTGAALGCGGIRFARAWDSSGALVNPSLLFELPRLTATVSGSFLSASLRKFAILNTGVLGSSGNFSQGVYGIEFGGFSIRTGNWALAAGAGVMAGFERPHLVYDVSDRGVPVYAIEFDQGGWLKVFHGSAAFKVSGRLSVGVGINAVTGKMERNLTEEYPADGISFLDRRNQNLKGIFANAGLTWTFSDSLTASVAFRAPYDLKSSGRSLLEYSVPAFDTDIRIEAQASDRARQPWVMGGGVSWNPTERFRLMSDLAFFKWSSYRLTGFEERLTRNFRDIVTLAAGFEYTVPYRLFGRAARSPLRAGFMIDPQPMIAPKSAYYAITLGGGLGVGRFHLDLGGAIGTERGSGDSLAVRRIAATLTYGEGPGL